MNMKRIGDKLLIGSALLAVSLCFSKPAVAATAYLTTDYSVVSVGDTILLSVAMDTAEKNPNTVEGTIVLKSGASNIEIQDFSLADSVLTNWLKTPSFEDGSKISFIGGVPGGFNQKSGLLFKIIFTAKAEGQVIFLPADMKAYDNDGKASPMSVSDTPLTITIGPKKGTGQKNQWLDVISGDNTPPEDLSVTIGRDSSIFDGKKFMAISAVDKQSGIDFFEVEEGNQPAVRSGVTYVLRDQTESSPITVSAYDKAGNKSTILLRPDKWKLTLVAWIGIAVVLSAAAVVAFRRLKYFKSMRKKNV